MSNTRNYKLVSGSRSVYEMFMIESGMIFPTEKHMGIYKKQNKECADEEVCRFNIKFSSSKRLEDSSIRQSW